MDMGGLGPLFNRGRYSRVHFWDKPIAPVLKMKQNYSECFMSLEKTVKAYDRNCPTPAPPETPPKSFVPIYGHYSTMMPPMASMFPPIMPMMSPTRRPTESPSKSRRTKRRSRSRERSRSRHRSKHHHHRRKSRDKYEDKSHRSHYRSKYSHKK